MGSVSEILDYWFAGADDQTPIDKKQLPYKRWFAGGRQVDAEIETKFLADLERARNGGCRDWEDHPQGRLALIILFDQFSRNIHRNSARMYETDPLALDLSLRMRNEEMDRKLPLIERIFCYMPFMHAEDPGMQGISVECFSGLVKAAKAGNPANAAYYEEHLQYARKYEGIIRQFGRFPHRNHLLQRPSTQEEIRFLNRKP